MIQRIYNWIRFIILVLFLTLVFASTANAQTKSDFGLWTTVDAQKDLGLKWFVGGGVELRTKNCNMDVDRWQLAMNSSYRLSKYFMWGGTYELHFKRYILGDDVVCGIRHRGMMDFTGNIKMIRWLKLSLRQRYEYTHLMSRSGLSASDAHEWRSRLKVTYDKANVKWSPFVSVEAFDDLTDNFRLDELRIASGTIYKFDNHSSVNFGNLMDFTWNGSGNQSLTSILTSGYTYCF